MINQNFEDAIKIINKKLKENEIKWVLAGSTNMQLQGMDVNPRDLDIVVQLKDLRKMNEIFKNYEASEVKELVPMTDEPCWEVKAKINGVEVQILGERDTGEYVSKLISNKIIKFKLGAIEISCFTLKAEAETYFKTKREHKSNLIKEFLKNKK